MRTIINQLFLKYSLGMMRYFVFLWICVIVSVSIQAQEDPSFDDQLAKAEAGSVFAMGGVAFRYEKGIGVEVNYEKANEWYQKAGRAGHVIAMHNLGVAYQDGKGVPKDLSMVEYWFKKAADKGYVPSILGLANLARLQNQPRKALEYFTIAAEKGNLAAMTEIASLYFLGGGLTVDYEKSRYWLEKAVHYRNWHLCSMMGYIYYYGKGGVNRDIYKALCFYQKAWLYGNQAAVNILKEIYGKEWNNLYANARNGNSEAMFNVGYALRYGFHESDLAEALRWFKAGADKGNANAMLEIANMFYYGKSLDKDLKLAEEWYEKSAEAGNVTAMWNLTMMYANGDFGFVDDVKSARWCEQAAVKKMSLAEGRMGYLYATGEGVEKDMEKAIYWLEIAASEGDDSAARNLTAARFQLGEELYKEKHDYEQALSLIEQAAMDIAYPVSGAMRLYSAYYRYGLAGMPIDEEKAQYWLNMAADYDDAKSINILGINN